MDKNKEEVNLLFKEVCEKLDKLSTKGWVLSDAKINEMVKEIMEEMGYHEKDEL
jgi:hypothetical protein